MKCYDLLISFFTIGDKLSIAKGFTKLKIRYLITLNKGAAFKLRLYCIQKLILYSIDK